MLLPFKKINTTMTTNKNEEWWDNEQSYQNKEKNKKTAENHLENLAQEINQKVNGKPIDLKIKTRSGRSDNNYEDMYTNELSKEDYVFYKDFYNKPITFYFDKFNKEYRYIKCIGTLLGTDKKYGNFFSKGKVILRKYQGDITIWFRESEITLDLDLSAEGKISSVEFISKESAQFLFEINRLIYSDFMPNMTCIKSQYSGLERPILISSNG
jgi:hypothetical protein